MLSMTSDYVTSTGDAQPYLKAIAGVGFSHVHWCHEWDSDHVYTDEEVARIGGWLRECGLRLNDLHASAGRRKCWGSLLDHERAGGVELVKNRIDMAGRLGSDVIIMHLPSQPPPAGRGDPLWAGLFRSLDALEPHARGRGVRIALENGDFDAIEGVLAQYQPGYLGLCYDSGHGNIAGDGLGRLDHLKDRLISIHLHDNDGGGDQHRLPFTGTVNWGRLARVIAASSYRKCISLEAVMRESPITDETEFLQQAFAAATRFAEMVERHRGAGRGPEPT